MSCAHWKEKKVVEARLVVLFVGGSVCLCGVGGPSLQEMELEVVRDAPPGPGGEQPYELLAWLNDTLQTSFTRVEQVCTGECQHTLMVLMPDDLTLCYSTLAYFEHTKSILRLRIHECTKGNKLMSRINY